MRRPMAIRLQAIDQRLHVLVAVLAGDETTSDVAVTTRSSMPSAATSTAVAAQITSADVLDEYIADR